MNDTKVLIHVDTSEVVGDCINGGLYILPPNEPTEFPVFVANALLNHKGPIHGIVEVEQVKKKNGVEYLVDEALEKAEKYLDECERKSIEFYVRQQMEDRIGTGKPSLPPNGRALSLILRRGISLKDEYGLVPVGWRDAAGSNPNTGVGQVPNTGDAAIQATLTSHKETIAQLEAQLADQAEVFAEQMAEVMKAIKGLTQAKAAETPSKLVKEAAGDPAKKA